MCTYVLPDLCARRTATATIGFVEPAIVVLSFPVPRVATNDENKNETRRWGKNDAERKRCLS